MPRLRDIALQDPALNQFKQAVKEWTDQAIGILNGINDEVQTLKDGASGSVPESRTITAGSGLTGGGDLSENRTLAVSEINDTQHGNRGGGALHADVSGSADGFMTVALYNKLDGLPTSAVPTTRSVIAGAGLTGGGQLTGDVTLNVVANADGSIVVAADDVKVGVISDAQHGTRGGGTLHPLASSGVAGFMAYAESTKLAGLPTIPSAGDLGTALVSTGTGLAPAWGNNFGAKDLVTTGTLKSPALDSNADTDLVLKRNGVTKMTLTGDYEYLSGIHYLVFPDDADGHILPMMAPASTNGRDMYIQGGYQGAGGAHGGYVWFFSGGTQLAVLTDTQFVTSLPFVSASGTDLDLRAASGRQVLVKLNTTTALTVGLTDFTVNLGRIAFPGTGAVIGVNRAADGAAGGGLTINSGQAGVGGSPDGTITFKTGLNSQLGISPTLISSALPITFTNATASVINTSSDDLLLKRAGSTKITIAAAGVTIHDALLTPVINSGSDTDLLLKRNSLTKVTIGTSGVTFADVVKALVFDSGQNTDLELRRNGSTKITVGASAVTLADGVIDTATVATDMVLKRYGTTKVTVGASGVTFVDDIIGDCIDTGANVDFVIKRNGTEDVRFSSSASGYSVYWGGTSGRQLAFWNSSGASPEGVCTAPFGSIYSAVGSTTAVPWFKTSGTGNTGWARIPTPAGITITAGSGAPSASEPNGSLYMRTDGGTETTMYFRAGGTWYRVIGYAL